MIKLIHTFTLATIFSMFTMMPSFAQESNGDMKIGKTISAYEKALNNKDIDRVLQLFSKDAVLVLQGAPTSIGSAAVKKVYVSLFESLDFNLKFHIEEIVQISEEWAFVRTTTSGSTHIRSNNSDIQSNGHELFILKKEGDGNWKIARYAGSSSK